MLLQFSFKNYKSFRDEATLDLTATKITEFNERTVKVGGEKVLTLATIFGANASGKSNLYDALKYMHDFIDNSLIASENDTEFLNLQPKRFVFDKETNDDSMFEVVFTIPNDNYEKIYKYGFIINKLEIKEEWLYSKAKTSSDFKVLFERNNNKISNTKLFKKQEREFIKAALDQKVLLLSFASKLKFVELKKISDWFKNNRFSDFANFEAVSKWNRTLPDGFTESESVRNDVINYLSSFDNSIVGFTIEELNYPGNETGYTVSSHHKMVDSLSIKTIPLEEESAGTLKMFGLYQNLHETLKNGGVYVVDELNARLHPLLVRNVLLMFLNPKLNRRNAQLIVTSHDTWQLSNNLLRRDEAWFVEKDNNGISHLYSLADFNNENGDKIRKDENYEKNYLLGKYGAIPILKNIKLNLGGSDEK